MQLLCAAALIAAYLSDKYKNRSIPVAVLSATAVVGFIIYYRQSYLSASLNSMLTAP